MIVRALLAAEGYLSAIREFWEEISQVPAGVTRNKRYVALGTSQVLVPMDLDSLAFLVLERSQDVLNAFSQLNRRDQQWQIYRAGLVESVSRNGTITSSELAARVRDIEQRTLQDLQEVPEIIKGIRTRIHALHPEWELPAIQAR